MPSHYRRPHGDLEVHPQFVTFVEDRLLPGTNCHAADFWEGLNNIVSELSAPNAALLKARDEMQQQIDDFHASNPSYAAADYETFLTKIGYLGPEEAYPTKFQISTTNVDPEICAVAGPQLVCPVDNARFVLNAANARWGSLFDAYYGTNALPSLDGAPGGRGYNEARGRGVHAAAHALLDECFPLAKGKWGEVTTLTVVNGALRIALGGNATAAAAKTTALADPKQLVGHSAAGEGAVAGRWSVLLVRHGLHVEVVLQPGAPRATAAGIVDIRLESALSTICDFEDSVATVDVADKVASYTNWLGLMDRTLTSSFVKGGETLTRTLNSPRAFTATAGGGHGGAYSVRGQAVLLCRNVGMHLMTDMVLYKGQAVPEHFVDALVTCAAALHDVRRHRSNSACGSIYMVKPKMHGAKECAHAATLFGLVEKVLGLPACSVKLGLMDEERRTSLNLAACVRALGSRLFFVNTGFLDRTGDEIHTSMRAGAMLPKGEIKKQAKWLPAYEQSNVRVALAAGVIGRGQIGKGMWAEPDDMASMLATKGSQLVAGASTAWVPSPTAATLHALHYLRGRGVAATQRALLSDHEGRDAQLAAAAHRAGLLTPPLLGKGTSLSAAEVQAELDNNAQGLLGYVARWVGGGIGCSKVPNLEGVALMEDRATLRISSQHLANWLVHGITNEAQLRETLARVAAIVDKQNARDPEYKPMAPAYDSPEWYCALELVFGGTSAPNGYTEEALTRWRRARKAATDPDYKKLAPLFTPPQSTSDAGDAWQKKAALLAAVGVGMVGLAMAVARSRRA